MTASGPIAIIGGGASAVLIVAALQAHRRADDLTIDIYDRAGAFARGIAYSTTRMAHLLNVRAGNMSALAADKDHFVRWAGTRGYGADDFVPRLLYGDYLAEQLSSAQKIFSLRCITEDVTACRADDTGYTLTYNGADTRYGTVILATGNAVALGPRVEDGAAGYHPNPWHLSAEDVRDVRSIGLIGSGLSAVDAVLTLQSLDYRGAITLLSRRTLLPCVHSAPAHWAHPPLERDDAAKPLSHLLGIIRTHVREAADAGIPWQAVIDSLRPHTNPLWQAFTPAQQSRFTRRLLTLWNIHRHRMAPSIAAKVHALQAEGRLHFIRDAVDHVAAGPHIIGARGTYPFDAVVNCMGYRYHESGRNLAHTHAIGPARFGPLFETTAIPEIRQQADDIARAL